MSKIQVLDCTVRDGGYINDWEFGEASIKGIRQLVAQTGVEIIELGFFRDEPFRADRAIFNSAESIETVIGEKEPGVLYAGFIETANYFPPEKLRPRIEGGLDAIRYGYWARLLDDAYAYCEHIKEKGYLLCCQPTRIETYTFEEFGAMCRRFSRLKPYALYIVDTFGLLRKDDLLRYAEVAHKNLDRDIILGYHAHDNMGQAFHNACAFMSLDFDDRMLQIDATVGGLGRGAGNLRLESAMEHLNTAHGKQYALAPAYKAWDDYIVPVKKEFNFGYDPAYFITAAHSCNPNYAQYYLDHGYTATQVAAAIARIDGADKFLYSDEKARRFMEEGAT